MGTHIQRKRFENLELASQAWKSFRDEDPSIPGARVVADVREVDGSLWLYVTSEGHLVLGAEPALADYEKVDG